MKAGFEQYIYYQPHKSDSSSQFERRLHVFTVFSLTNSNVDQKHQR